MARFTRYIAFVLITAGITMAVVYIYDLYKNDSVIEEIRSLREQTAQTQVTQSFPGSPALSTTITSDDEQVASAEEQPFLTSHSPFADLRRFQLPVKASPLMDLFNQNNDLVGWIKIDDTRIDYPIVKGKDNDFYLRRGFDRENNRAGSIFMDYRNIGDGSDLHTIIYGHRMRNQSMFYDLLSFQDPSFYESHRVIAIETLYGRKEYRVFAAYTTSTDFYFIQTRFDPSTYAKFIAEVKNRSDYDWDTKVHFGDPILTLATCSYDFEDARFVVHAVLINPEPLAKEDDSEVSSGIITR
jgi:sortase B